MYVAVYVTLLIPLKICISRIVIYLLYFCRLEEGEGPGTKRRERLKDGWEKMEEYYAYLRSRQIKYSI